MISKFICFLFGHVYREKVYTGKTMKAIHLLGNEYDTLLFVWRDCNRCPRCGKNLNKECEK